MASSVAAVVLGAGTGRRLRPLTELRPKVLCPVANRALLDWALDRVRAVTTDVAVNVHHHRDQLLDHLAEASGRDPAATVHASIEADRPLGTAGALGALRDWVGGRAVLVVNGDTWCPAPLLRLLEGWDGERVRVLVLGGDPLGPRSRVIGSLTPWPVVSALPAAPLGLWEGVWRPRVAGGTLETVGWEGPFVDCASPADYLTANLAALDWLGRDRLVAPDAVVSGDIDRSVVGAGARVVGRVVRAVVWPGAEVARSERLVDAIRADRDVTVLLR
jgi:mannose-1-phosphate guanylyltransferase/MurNAc alpha-1-phosphate uridylyltransferase